MTKVVRGSEQGIVRRLGLLYHHGYLTRPPAQRRFYEREMNVPMVYGITKKGHTALLKAERLQEGAPVNSSNMAGGLFLEHTIEVADFVIGFEAESRKTGRVLSDTEVFHKAPKEPAKPIGAFKWTVEVQDGGERRRLTVIPDAVVGVEEGGDPKQRVIYLIEVDRGTMPVSRRSLEQTSLRRKVIGYNETWKQSTLREKFGWRRWRVLTVVGLESRLARLRDTADAVTEGAGEGRFPCRSPGSLSRGNQN